MARGRLQVVGAIQQIDGNIIVLAGDGAQRARGTSELGIAWFGGLPDSNDLSALRPGRLQVRAIDGNRIIAERPITNTIPTATRGDHVVYVREPRGANRAATKTRIELREDAGDVARWKDAADAERLSLSAWIRHLLNERANSGQSRALVAAVRRARSEKP